MALRANKEPFVKLVEFVIFPPDPLFRNWDLSSALLVITEEEEACFSSRLLNIVLFPARLVELPTIKLLFRLAAGDLLLPFEYNRESPAESAPIEGLLLPPALEVALPPFGTFANDIYCNDQNISSVTKGERSLTCCNLSSGLIVLTLMLLLPILCRTSPDILALELSACGCE